MEIASNIRAAWVACLVLALASCAARTPAPTPAAVTVPTPVPTTTRGQFTIRAVPLDVWNAIGDIVVRTPQASYDSRSRMLGLYSVQYRGQPLLVVAHALPLSETVQALTTGVTAKSPSGAPVDDDIAAELLAVLQRELPAEIERVRARQAAQAASEARAEKTRKTAKKKAKNKAKKK